MTGPWAGLPVAWHDDLSFDEDAYRANVAKCCRAGMPGVYTGGTTGEFYAMEMEEWKAINRATIAECKKAGTPVMIGVTSTYTLGAQRRAAWAAEMGADAIQLALPFWMEVNDRELPGYFRAVTSACPGLVLSVYETLRSKKRLTVEQHRAIYEETGCYMAVKSNAGTVGCTPEGCERLSEFINVWVGEKLWSELGPHGAIGCASALVYKNPRVILLMFDLLRGKKWDELKKWTDLLHFYDENGLKPFTEKGFMDSAYDHMQGLAAGFLGMNPVSRGPYISATAEDVAQLRQWMQENTPELLRL
jgi:dihydrodipicolinate synthase/N-acetylneuraminate lyase